jgi:hypothetical protein
MLPQDLRASLFLIPMEVVKEPNATPRMLNPEGTNACCLYTFISSEAQLFADHFSTNPCASCELSEATRIFEP